MGCIVNGPGESKHADIGISLPGTGEAPVAPVFIDGKKAMTLRGANIAAEFKAIVEDYVARRYGAQNGRARKGRVTAVAAQRRLHAERGRLTPMIELRSLTALVLALTISGTAHGEAITFGPDLAASG